VKTISSESFELFHQIQEGILKEKQNVGLLDFHRWRYYKPTIQPNDQDNIFIDGDILKLYFTMSLQDKQKVLLNGLQDYKVREIEDLIHSLVSL
jgi:hypothetical protein